MLARHGVTARSTFVEVPSVDGRAQVLVHGEGPPVVIVNGIGTPAAMWAPLLAELGGFRLLVVDLPGYGLTDTVPGIGRDLRRLAVRFLEEVLDALGLDGAAFVANSLGSLWTSWLALDRPGRVRAMVHVGCPAVVLDTSAPLPMRLLSVRPLGRLLTRLQPPSRGQVEQLGRMVREDPLEPELVDLLLATERLPGFRATFLQTLHALLRLGGNRPERRLGVAELERVAQPTLLIWGEHDPFGSPEVGARVEAVIPHAELHVIGGGHAPWLRRARAVAALAEPFLLRHA